MVEKGEIKREKDKDDEEREQTAHNTETGRIAEQKVITCHE